MHIPQAVADRIARWRYAKHIYRTPLDRYRVSIARRVEQYEAAFRLLHIAYAYQGYESVMRPAMRITARHVLPESTVLVACEDGQLVGTMTLTLDSPAGLPIDADYPDLLRALRGQGLRLVEYGSLAVVRRCCHSGVTTLLNIAAHWLSTKLLGATHCVMGVNPKAAPLYRALYNFRQLGPPQGHSELRAPVQGMSQELATVRDHCARYLNQPMESGLYFHEHISELLPRCVELPSLALVDQGARWKLPREVFRSLFIEKSDRLSTLDPRTRSRLHDWRSLRTTAAGLRRPLERVG